MSTVIVLNGTSSSGKTSMAQAFQELSPRLFLNFSIDSILHALPQSALARITAGDEISDLGLPSLVRAFYACVRQLLDFGHDLVIDHAVTARYHVEALLAAVEGHEALVVGLDCPAEILIERERNRGDRRSGMAVQQQQRIHAWLAYDLVIDTGAVSAHDAARRIVELLESGRGEGIKKTRARLNSG